MQAHLDRMRKIEAYFKVQREKQATTGADMAAQESYRLEAGRELARARGK